MIASKQQVKFRLKQQELHQKLYTHRYNYYTSSFVIMALGRSGVHVVKLGTMNVNIGSIMIAGHAHNMVKRFIFKYMLQLTLI